MENNSVPEAQEEEEDALSLCDLPSNTTHQSKEDSEKDDNTPLVAVATQQEDFDDFIFCSLSKQPEMCAADEVFYQGRILPLLTTAKHVFVPYCDNRSVSSYDDHFSSGVPISSRSSGSGSSAAGGVPKLPPRKKSVRSNARKKTSGWDIFRPGLLISPPAEIAFQDLKNRYHSNNFANRNSRRCSEKKKMKRRGFLGKCRCCSSDAVDAVRSNVVVIKRSERDGESDDVRVEEEEENLLKRLSD